MSLLRRMPISRLLLLCAAVVAFSVGATTIASALTSGGPVPAGESLAAAVKTAMSAPPVQGVTARVEYTNRLIDPGVIPGNSLLTGATGRVWVAPGHGLRIELQTSPAHSQLVVRDGSFWAYDGHSNTVYRGTLPRRGGGTSEPGRREAPHTPPTVAEIQTHLDQLAKHVNLSGPQPGNTAGQPAYTVSVTPRSHPGLLGPAQVAWDAVRGIPLRLAIYARGSDQPVLEVKVTEIAFGPVPAADLAIAPPSDARVVEVKTPTGAHGAKPSDRRAPDRSHPSPVSGVSAVQAKLPFKLSAPDTLAGQPRHEVKLFTVANKPVALVSYGEGLDGFAVIERPVEPKKPGAPAPAPSSDGSDGEHRGGLPAVSVGATSGHELATALGTLVTFQRAGVDYAVVGSVPQSTAETAARAL